MPWRKLLTCRKTPAAGFPRFTLAGEAMLVGIGADDAAVAGYRPQACSTDRARMHDQSIVRRDINPLSVTTDGTGEVGLEDGGE